MGRLLTLVLSYALPQVIATVLKYIFGGVVGLVSYQFMSVLIDRYIRASIQQLSSLDPTIAAMINISGLDVCISIIFSAIVIRVSIISMGLTVTKGGSK
jgi:hypothetical protein